MSYSEIPPPPQKKKKKQQQQQQQQNNSQSKENVLYFVHVANDLNHSIHQICMVIREENTTQLGKEGMVFIPVFIWQLKESLNLQCMIN